MRLLVTSVPGLGHLHPVLPLALAAAAAGHEVLVATGADRIGWVRECGCEAVAAGSAYREISGQADVRGLDGVERATQMFTTIAVPPLAEDLLELVDDWRPDVLLHEEGEYAAPLVAALCGLPCVTQSWSAPARTVAGRALLQGPLQAVWRRFGAGGTAGQVGSLYLDACPPPLQVADVAVVGARVVAVHPTGFDGPPEPVHGWLESLPRPAAYLTLGTVPRFCRPDLLQRLVDAVAAVVPGVVVTTGPHPPDVLRTSSPDVHAAQYLRQSAVLPHVDAVVSHAGAGTTAGALLNGVPLLLLPAGTPSQQAGAARVAAAGLGLRLAWADASPGRLRAAVAELLSRADLRSAASRAREDLDRLPRPAQVVPLVEALSVRA
ncbi:nucleotide disphospho-sugar-binding domain-containing protein [Blastococcus sp. URHD0036]|uniref:nucleotide disphospho-sugar-binding domain-containing protein n=1 Tax=Blastococcus sp. URHD0036 TaxID=1380356 RepID=UPI0004980FE6|nr:nucleotide disphospho-sugar-binding domain-containing protein [Blastococcus sp. URHD0036]